MATCLFELVSEVFDMSDVNVADVVNFSFSKEVRRQQVGTRTKTDFGCFGLRNLPWFRLCCGVKVAEYLQRIVRLVILFLLA